MIFPSAPKNFLPDFRLASNFVWWKGKILLLHRQKIKSQGNRWGQPAGKIELKETEKEAAIRELYEETGILADSKQLLYWKHLYVQHDKRNFSDALFYIPYNKQPKVHLNQQEHKNYGWFTPEESLRLNLVDDLDVCIRMFLKDFPLDAL